MDPNECLRQIKELMADAAQGIDVRRNERELRWKLAGLLDWLAAGNFAPDWTKWTT